MTTIYFLRVLMRRVWAIIWHTIKHPQKSMLEFIFLSSVPVSGGFDEDHRTPRDRVIVCVRGTRKRVAIFARMVMVSVPRPHQRQFNYNTVTINHVYHAHLTYYVYAGLPW